MATVTYRRFVVLAPIRPQETHRWAISLPGDAVADAISVTATPFLAGPDDVRNGRQLRVDNLRVLAFLTKFRIDFEVFHTSFDDINGYFIGVGQIAE